MRWCNVQTNGYDHQDTTYHDILEIEFTHLICWKLFFVCKLCLRGAIWCNRSRSTLTQVLGYFLMPPSQFQNQSWLTKGVLWCTSEWNFTWSARWIFQQNKCKNYTFKIILQSPRQTWIKKVRDWEYKVLTVYISTNIYQVVDRIMEFLPETHLISIVAFDLEPSR